MNKLCFSDEEFIEIVKASKSISQVIRKLNLKISGNSHKQFHKNVKRLNCDISHFKGRAHGTSISNKKIPIEEILKENTVYNTTDLKKRLIKESFFENKCYFGHLPEWMGVELKLHLDHINGKKYDNRIENLRLLCPNCHSITPTYCRGERINKINYCNDCGIKITKKHQHCISCSNKKRKTKAKINWPDPKKLYEITKTKSLVKIALELGVSDNAIRKYLKKHGYDTKKYKVVPRQGLKPRSSDSKSDVFI